MIMSDIAVKLHGALMHLIPSEYAERLHSGTAQPFSIFVLSADEEGAIMARISALCDEARLIGDALCAADELKIYGMRTPMRMLACQQAPPMSVDMLSDTLVGDAFRLSFLSPSMIKKNGKPSCSLNLGKYFRSVIEKLNSFEGQQLDAERICTAISELEITGFDLSTSLHNVAGSYYPGMSGYADIRLRNNMLSQQIKQVLAYAEYSGVGAKTALGMGGFMIESI